MANETKAKGMRRPGAGGQVGAAHADQAPEVKQPETRTPGAEQKKPEQFGVDASRAADSPVNRKPTLSYAQAMAQREAGTLMRAVLTDQGWVMPSTSGRIRLEG